MKNRTRKIISANFLVWLVILYSFDLNGQNIISADNFVIASQDSLLRRADNFMLRFHFLNFEEKKLLHSAATCYLDVVPENYTYVENILLLDSQHTLDKKISILKRNPDVFSNFNSALIAKGISQELLLKTYNKLLVYFYCEEITKDIMNSKVSDNICLCCVQTPPDASLIVKNIDQYFNALEIAIMNCYTHDHNKQIQNIK